MSIDREFDKAHLWHPYTSPVSPLPVYGVTHAQGCRLYLDDGRELIDGTSSWWAAVHGYNHPQLNAAITAQLSNMAHVMFGGITHEPAIALGKALLTLLPKSLTRIFYADSGSIAVEVALKMALQYQKAKQASHKTKILSLRKAYHGDTFAAMSVCDPVDGMHGLFQEQLIPQLFAAAPRSVFAGAWDADDDQSLRAMFAKHHHELAAMIVEPILQGAGGMRFYHPEYLRLCRKLCDEYEVLLIADEIATGFGRTGKLFACDHADILPDIMCLGKALSGGYLTLGATVCTEHVAQVIGQGQVPALMHGPTFMANPLACAVATESMELIAAGDWQQQVASIEHMFKTALLNHAWPEVVVDVRVLGAIAVVETKHTIDVAKAQQQMVDQGVWIRPFGRIFYLMPPFIITEQELSRLCQVLRAIVDMDIYQQQPGLPGA